MAEAILVADDETGVRESLAEVLRDGGYAVDTVVDGSAALAALDERDFAVVITDLRMPGADGLTVLRKLREVARQTLAIVMTAHGSVESAVEALRAGAADYILNPCCSITRLRNRSPQRAAAARVPGGAEVRLDDRAGDREACALGGVERAEAVGRRLGEADADVADRDLDGVAVCWRGHDGPG